MSKIIASAAIRGAHEIDQSKCLKCGVCLDTSKFDAVEVR